MKGENYISIFRGAVVEADQVHDYLSQHNIGSLVRNHIQENLSAAWISEADHAAEVFVSSEDKSAAEKLIKNMFHESNEEDHPVEKKKK